MSSQEKEITENDINYGMPCFLIIVGIVIGCFVGNWYNQYQLETKAIKHKFGQYNQHTADFEFIIDGNVIKW